MKTKEQRTEKFEDFIGSCIHSLVWGLPLLAMVVGIIFLALKAVEWLKAVAALL